MDKTVKTKISRKKEVVVEKGLKSNLISIGFIIILSFILYGNTIRNDYSLDDNFVTNKNELVQMGLKAIPEIFSSFYSQGEGKFNYGYRPVPKLTFALEYEFFGANPHVSHLINILLYAFTGIMLFVMLRRLFRNYNYLMSLVITVLFIAHPLHTEVVASLKNRDEMLGFIGSILSLLFIIRFADSKRIYFLLAGIFFFLFGLLSKTSTLVFAAIIPLTLYFFSKAGTKTIIIYFASLIVLFVAVFIISRMILPEPNRDKFFFENPLFFDKSINHRIGTALYVLLFYLRLLILPHPLSFYYGYEQVPIANISDLLPLISLIIFLFVFIYAILNTRKNPILSYGILFFMISISMFLNLIKPAMGIVAERYAYASVLGFSICLAYFIFKLLKVNLSIHIHSLKMNNAIIFVMLLILIPYSIKTIARNSHWKDQLTLFTHDIKYLDNSAKAQALYAGGLMEHLFEELPVMTDKRVIRSKVDEILHAYDRCLEIYPKYATAWNNIGYIYYMFFQEYAKAINYFKKAIEHYPRYTDAYYHMGLCFEQLKDTVSAIRYFETTTAMDPSYIGAYAKLSNIYAGKRNFDEALKINKKIMDIDPKSDIPYMNLGSYAFMQADTITAIRYFEIAMEVNPSNFRMAILLRDYFQSVNNRSKAKYYNGIAAQAQTMMNQRKDNR